MIFPPWGPIARSNDKMSQILNKKKLFSNLTNMEKGTKLFNSGVKVLGQDQNVQVVNMFLILKNIPYSHINLRYKT